MRLLCCMHTDKRNRLPPVNAEVDASRIANTPAYICSELLS